MSDQNPPVPDPARPEQPPAAAAGPTPPPAAVPAPPGWAPGATGAAAAPAPSGPRRRWDEATSTGGGRAALIALAVLGTLVVLAGMGLTAALVVGHDRDDRGFFTGEMGHGDRDGMGPGNGRGNGNGNGNGKGFGPDKGQGNGNGLQRAPGQGNPANPADPGPGMGMGRGAGAALGAVLHGEFTTNLTGTPTVMVVQTGQVSAYTAGKSLTVTSTDGFKATYTLDAESATLGRTAEQLATGVQVRVLAAKEGMKVTALVVG